MKLNRLTDEERSLHNKVHEYAVNKHRETGCSYSGYDYKLHLDAVVNVGLQYLHLLDAFKLETLCVLSLHDVMEDCRVNWNEIKMLTCSNFVSDCVYNLTNELGRNRSERAKKTYPKIAQCKYSTFCKICDRIANMKFSYFMNDEKGMFKKYQDEHDGFWKALYNKEHGFDKMWEEMATLCSC